MTERRASVRLWRTMFRARCKCCCAWAGASISLVATASNWKAMPANP